MKFSLIICTYMRPKALITLLKSVKEQLMYPDQIIIVDGSTDFKTKKALKEHDFDKLSYYLVDEKDRGLTRQRNFGIDKLSDKSEIVCFLDDDIVLEKEYFQALMDSYQQYPEAVGIGGYIVNDSVWSAESGNPGKDEYQMDGFKRSLGKRNLIRKKIGLLSDQPPGIMPVFSHGLSIGFLPPSGLVYAVEYFMGGVSSFKSKLLKEVRFSTYFEGYGLYEDLDFCLRASKKGLLYVNTAARLYHYHEESGRPNKFSYGKMVVRNGWYVWRVKYPSPGIKAILKWHLITLLLMKLRFLNVLTASAKRAAFTEASGRLVGWFSLYFNKPA